MGEVCRGTLEGGAGVEGGGEGLKPKGRGQHELFLPECVKMGLKNRPLSMEPGYENCDQGVVFPIT